MDAAPHPRRGAPPSRRGAPRKDETSARDRILATASDLFYREGIRAIGVDTVVERSGVSKTSLYRLFDSKDALIAAVTAEQSRLFWAWWDRIQTRHPDDPRAQLETLLANIARRVAHPDYRGCPFLNLMTEFPDDAHPGRVIARATKQEMRHRLTTLVAHIGVAAPARTAAQIALLIDGTYAGGPWSDPDGMRADLIDAVDRLLA